MQSLREIDESACLVEAGRALGGLGLVHVRGGAEIRYTQLVAGDLTERVVQSSGSELRAFGEVHLLLETAQLDRGKAVRRREVEYMRPLPVWTSERREAEWQTRGTARWFWNRSHLVE